MLTGTSGREAFRKDQSAYNSQRERHKNDPNDWAEETGNPRYILDLLLSIINVSVQTVDIVEGLPRLNFEIAAD